MGMARVTASPNLDDLGVLYRAFWQFYTGVLKGYRENLD